MKVNLGVASKEINSTKIISLTTAVNDLELKEGCSMTAPVFKIHESVWKSTYNYLYVPKWGRYYFIHDAVILPGGIFQLSCVIDVLASWKSYIVNSTAYVSRSASNYDLMLPDSTWSHTEKPVITSSSIDVGYNTTGVYLLTVSGKTGSQLSGNPSLSTFALTGIELSTICEYMFSSDFYSAVTSAVTDTNLSGFGQAIFNPFQYVVNCMWFPYNKADVLGINTNIQFGWWDSGISGKMVSTYEMTTTFNISTGTGADWTDYDTGWKSISVYVPGFQSIAISPEYSGQTLTATLTTDLNTGESAMLIYSSGKLIQSATGRTGCSVQLSSLYESTINDLGENLAGTLVKAGVGAATGLISGAKNIASKITDVLTGSVSAVDFAKENAGTLAESVVNGAQSALSPTMSSVGSNGSRAVITNQLTALVTIRKYTRYEDITERLGGVCNKVLSLSDLSGYTQVVNPHVNVPATSGEITMLNSYLSGGFYIE